MKGDAVVLQQANGRIAYRFQARDVNLVMGSNARGFPASSASRGSINSPVGQHEGVQAYSFTFG
jgi:adenine/guanine phosphoribosyltransferase-like PRPP-binding protein